MQWRSRSKTAAPAAAPAVQLDDNPFTPGDLYDLSPFAPKSTVPVPGLYEATTSCTFDDPSTGWPLYLRGPAKDRLGTIAAEGSPILKARGELFRPLRVPVDFPAPPSG